MLKKHFLFGIMLVSLLSACGSYNANDSDGTGSIAFSVDWQGAPTLAFSGSELLRAASLDCAASGVSTVEAKVYDSPNNLIASGGPWNCDVHSGAIYSVPAGSNRMVVILGKDSIGNVKYRGEQTGITVTAGQTTNAGTITASVFTPIPVSPSNGSTATPGNIGFTWTGTGGSYRLQVSTSNNFVSTIIDTGDIPGWSDAYYPPTPFLIEGTYYWRVRARDNYNNYSAWSEVWNFTVVSQITYQFVTKWGSYGSGSGQFNSPWGVTVDSSGNVYVADYINARIQKFNSNGAFITKWGSVGAGDGQYQYPMGIAVDSLDNIYVSEGNVSGSSNDRIQKSSSDGTFIAKWGSSGSGDGQFGFPRGVAVDPSGNVYVADRDNHRIQKFDPSGTFITKWGTKGSGDGQLTYPEGIAVDSSGNVYVADTGNNRIQEFDSIGTFITKWGSSGSGDGQFNYPIGIVVDSSGNVYVVDSNNSRIQKFSQK